MKKKIAIIGLVVLASLLASCSDPAGQELFENIELNNVEYTGGFHIL